MPRWGPGRLARARLCRGRRAGLAMLAPVAAGLALAPGAIAAPAIESAFVTDGPVHAVARSGGITYIGGSFSELRAQTGGAARVSSTSGKRFVASPVVTGEVLASAPDGAGGAFIGGTFTHVGGVARRNIAHILPDGTVDPAFNPDANNTVLALAVSGNDVYAGGLFSGPNSIGGQERNFIAKLSAASGNAFSAWDPDANGAVFALAVSGSDVYAGGVFDGPDSIGGRDRNRIAKLSAASGNAFSAWDPDANSVVNALAVAGNDVYAGGNFDGPDSIGGRGRNRIAKLSAASGNAFSAWDPDANNAVNALAFSGSHLYVGGAFAGADSIGGQPRNHIAKLSAASGNAFSAWNPDANATVNALAVDEAAVYAGGGFMEIGGLPLAGFPRRGFAQLPR